MAMEITSFRIGIVGHDSSLTARINTGPRELSDMLGKTAGTFEDAARVIEDQHKMYCSCDIQDIGLRENIWLANLAFGRDMNTALEDYHPAAIHRWTRPKDRILDVLRKVDHVPGSRVIPVMFGRELDENERQRLFRGTRGLHESVCRVSYSATRILPSPAACDFYKFIHTKGLCYIDHTDSIAPWYYAALRKSGSERSYMPIIRRPSGFGKSTMPPHDGDWNFELEGRFMCLQLDLAELDSLDRSNLKPFDVAEVEREVAAFMTENALRFRQRYLSDEDVMQNIWRPVAPYMSDDEARASATQDPWQFIKRYAVDSDCKIFLVIDNYTHPFLERDAWTSLQVEEIIWRLVLSPIFLDIGDGSVVERGFITGLELPGFQHRPFSDCVPFAQATEDITYSEEYAHVMGFRVEDVTDLGRALEPDSDFDAQDILHDGIPDDTILCVRDVVDVLRARKEGQVPSGPQRRSVRWIRVNNEDADEGLTPSRSHDYFALIVNGHASDDEDVVETGAEKNASDAD
ncbi:hypothetical protein EXIGLDRAFT_838405 [Exidia glandulosa HHB12029]|uniref:AAA-ATPase-like domain-containing protein n=1 Tax=Exidia glandulosa HHB12029 TaxID=1314781 RepID=A0A165FVZ5_EXIGL|nr:hypothetical protein EXIGLDRAFT_838405 [Exidia glandulosa HHB12029]